MSYYETLNNNILEHGDLVPLPVDIEWKHYFETKLQYDPRYDYLNDGTLTRLINQFKHDPTVDNADQVAKEILVYPSFSGKVNKHKLCWVYWWQYKRDDFYKNYKPIDNVGLKYLTIDINYKVDSPLDKCIFHTNRIFDLSIFKNSKVTYCYDHFTDHGERTHVHSIIELHHTGSIPLSKIIEKIFQDKSVYKYIDTNGVEVKFSHSRDSDKRATPRLIRLAYIAGNKREEKMENVEADRIWRIENNLQNIYEKEL